MGPLMTDGARSAAQRVVVPIAVDLDVVSARQQGRELAVGLGCSSTEATLIATAISELARNILVYAKQGEIELAPVSNGSQHGIIIIARDQGPGIADISRATSGGFSSSGGLGLGLAGVRRLMDEFEISSALGKGTTVTVKRWKR
jgi:serine/threonine-protein kinase RsbT